MSLTKKEQNRLKQVTSEFIECRELVDKLGKEKDLLQDKSEREERQKFVGKCYFYKQYVRKYFRIDSIDSLHSFRGTIIMYYGKSMWTMEFDHNIYMGNIEESKRIKPFIFRKQLAKAKKIVNSL